MSIILSNLLTVEKTTNSPYPYKSELILGRKMSYNMKNITDQQKLTDTSNLRQNERLRAPSRNYVSYVQENNQ